MIARRRVLPPRSNGRKVVVFVSEPPIAFDTGASYRTALCTLVGRGSNTERTQIVLEEFLDALDCLKVRPYAILRPHPRSCREDFSQYLDRFDYVCRGSSSLELISVTDLVVGMTSMMLFEAALMGKPTLSIVPRWTEREWLPTIGMGVTQCVATREDLRAILPPLINRNHVSRSLDIPLGATQRLTKKVLEHLRKPSVASNKRTGAKCSVRP